MTSQPVVVVGDGWAALAAVAFFVHTGVKVCWIAGTGSRLLAAHAGIEEEVGSEFWIHLAHLYQIPVGELHKGMFLREFRNKAWREPLWNRSINSAERAEVLKELLWEPERRFVLNHEVRLEKALFELEEELRKILLAGDVPHLRRIEGLPLSGFLTEDGGIRGVKLGSGEEILAQQVVYADRWSILPTLENFPKTLSFMRKRGPTGVLQASFLHEPSLKEGVLESFFAPMHKESGEKIERHFWGCISSEGKRSVWALCLSPEEAEDNHEIAKKLRKLKSGLDKAFAGSDLIASGSATFTSTVSEEQIRFEEEVVFSEGEELSSPIELPQVAGLLLMTDGYGPGFAIMQVGSALGVDVLRPDSKSEGMNMSDSTVLE